MFQTKSNWVQCSKNINEGPPVKITGTQHRSIKFSNVKKQAERPRKSQQEANLKIPQLLLVSFDLALFPTFYSKNTIERSFVHKYGPSKAYRYWGDPSFFVDIILLDRVQLNKHSESQGTALFVRSALILVSNRLFRGRLTKDFPIGRWITAPKTKITGCGASKHQVTAWFVSIGEDNEGFALDLWADGPRSTVQDLIRMDLRRIRGFRELAGDSPFVHSPRKPSQNLCIASISTKSPNGSAIRYRLPRITVFYALFMAPMDCVSRCRIWFDRICGGYGVFEGFSFRARPSEALTEPKEKAALPKTWNIRAGEVPQIDSATKEGSLRTLLRNLPYWESAWSKFEFKYQKPTW